MTRMRFLLALTAFVASLGPLADVQAGPPFDVPPADPPPNRGGPVPVLGAGLPAILAAGAALVGYRLWRRRRRPTDVG